MTNEEYWGMVEEVAGLMVIRDASPIAEARYWDFKINDLMEVLVMADPLAENDVFDILDDRARRTR